MSTARATQCCFGLFVLHPEAVRIGRRYHQVRFGGSGLVYGVNSCQLQADDSVKTKEIPFFMQDAFRSRLIHTPSSAVHQTFVSPVPMPRLFERQHRIPGLSSSASDCSRLRLVAPGRVFLLGALYRRDDLFRDSPGVSLINNTHQCGCYVPPPWVYCPPRGDRSPA